MTRMENAAEALRDARKEHQEVLADAKAAARLKKLADGRLEAIEAHLKSLEQHVINVAAEPPRDEVAPEGLMGGTAMAVDSKVYRADRK